MLKRTFVSRDIGLWKERKHFEGDIGKIERVQRRATRIPFGFGKSSIKND